MSMPVRALVLAVLIAAAARADAAPSIKIMLLDGESGGPWHKWQLTTPVLKKMLEDTGLFQVDVVTAPPAGGDFTAFKPEFSAYRAVVLELRCARRALARGAEGGVRAVRHRRRRRSHRARGRQRVSRLDRIQRDDRRRRLARPDREGRPATGSARTARCTSDPSPGPPAATARACPSWSRCATPTHPITRGLPKTWMHQGDELYASLRGPGKNMTVLATGHSRSRQRGHRTATSRMLMVLTHGKGRIFHTTLGHDVNGISSRRTSSPRSSAARNGPRPAAVTQKVPATFPAADAVAYRADLAAMDPDFEKGLNRLDPPPPQAAAAGSPFAGTWTITGDVVGNPVNSTCTFRVDGTGKVDGTCAVPSGETKATGQVKGTDARHSRSAYARGHRLPARVHRHGELTHRHQGHDRRLGHAGGVHGDEEVGGGRFRASTQRDE